MWQSAAIAAGFGTYFQFAKRRVSAMSNEEFNNANPHDLVNTMYNDIIANIPSSFTKVDDLTTVILQHMNIMLDKAVKFLGGFISGNLSGEPNPVLDEITPTPEAIPDTTTLLSLSADTISLWSNAKLANEHFVTNIIKYDEQTQVFIRQFYQTRLIDTIPENTSCPDGQIWDPVSKTCIPIISETSIPRMTEVNVKLHARGRASRVIASGGFFTEQWLLQTNPQRNGSYQTKDTANSTDDAQSWLNTNFPQSTHGQWNFKTFAVGEWRYKVLQTDVTIKNFS